MSNVVPLHREPPSDLSAAARRLRGLLDHQDSERARAGTLVRECEDRLRVMDFEGFFAASDALRGYFHGDAA